MFGINQGLMRKVDEVALPEGFTIGERYYRVIFHINTPAYRTNGNIGFSCDEERKSVEKVMKDQLVSFGFTANEEKKGGYIYKGEFGSLYIHPDTLSGFLTMDDIVALHDKLESHREVFTLRWTEVFAAHEAVSEEEVLVRLSLSRSAIEAAIINKLTTRFTKNYFKVDLWSPMTKGMKGFVFVEQKQHSILLHNEIQKIANRLVQSGQLKTIMANGAVLYRTANKTELARLNAKKNNKHTQEAQAAFKLA